MSQYSGMKAGTLLTHTGLWASHDPVTQFYNFQDPWGWENVQFLFEEDVIYSGCDFQSIPVHSLDTIIYSLPAWKICPLNFKILKFSTIWLEVQGLFFCTSSTYICVCMCGWFLGHRSSYESKDIICSTLHTPNIQWWNSHQLIVTDTPLKKEEKQKTHSGTWPMTILKYFWGRECSLTMVRFIIVPDVSSVPFSLSPEILTTHTLHIL